MIAPPYGLMAPFPRARRVSVFTQILTNKNSNMFPIKDQYA
ncbi:hypothetical protein HMPREF0496_0298 [Lentilactobacillus hilgardii ATCC 27305]|uniref:Uncharacterized protein n=2 Tax=Lentilactobacillus hilgardii TaxID=1588 RepID=C0XIJ4_LENH9|nr:hypothetical protein HMPREF0519_1055 [Lentilactobacillus hilgardii DSM 20176 = ATCC 8290]EEI72431.1 hypothetical protein HMPREF0496_0298 [Lentilactobacillus hilgardii ATCC 27305]